MPHPITENDKDINVSDTALDATIPKNSEQLLQDTRELYRAVFEQATDSIMLLDTDSLAILDFNDSASSNTLVKSSQDSTWPTLRLWNPRVKSGNTSKE